MMVPVCAACTLGRVCINSRVARVIATRLEGLPRGVGTGLQSVLGGYEGRACVACTPKSLPNF